MDVPTDMETNQGALLVNTNPCNPATVLDLNPTGFVDDLYNAVELHLATGFERLDIALRNELKAVSTPEQQVFFLQGTAGVYQDLKEELKNRMQTFEQYALAEILKVPAGLLADPIAADDADAEDVTEEEENEVDAELLELQKEIAAGKRHGREAQAAIARLEHLIQSLANDLTRLEAIPSVLASKENLLDDLKTVIKQGTAVEANCQKLDTLRNDFSMTLSSKPSQDNTNTTISLATALHQGASDALEDITVEREILRRAVASKNAPAEDLNALRESFGIS